MMSRPVADADRECRYDIIRLQNDFDPLGHNSNASVFEL